MKKIYLLMSMLCISMLSFGQTNVEIINETLGDGGYWIGPMNSNPNLTSTAMFSDHKMLTQTWNASSGYDQASGGYHGIMNNTEPTDTLLFAVNTIGFENVQFALGAFSWGSQYGQFKFEYSEDSTTWVEFDKDNIESGDLYAGGWTFVKFSEILPSVSKLWIMVTLTSEQVHFDDLTVTGDVAVNNAFLSSLSLDVGDIDFTYHKNDYEVWVPYGTTASPTITYEAFSSAATVNVTDAADITSATEADRTSTVEVVAEDGTTTNTYNIVFNVTPPREDATLTDIGLGYGMLAPAFAADQMGYLVDLPDTATVAPEVTPVLSDNAASYVLTEAVDITSANRTDRTTSIEVTAQDGVTSLTYEVEFKVGGESTDLFLMDVETFGDVGNKYDIVLSSYSGFTSDFVWGDQRVAIRTSNPSTGYTNASGANRLEVQAGWGDGMDTAVFMTNTSNMRNTTLAFGVYNNSGADGGASTAFKAYYSTDSVTWTPTGNETQGGTAFPVSNAWSYVILDDVLPSDDSLYIMFANEDPNFEYYLDDISIWGTPLNRNNQLGELSVAEGTLDPAFDPKVMEYVVELPQGSSETPAVTATQMDASAILEVNDAPDIRSVNISDNTTVINVTAETGEVRTYEVVFDVYMSSDATLSELSAGDYFLAPAFSNDISSYAVKLPAGTTEAPVITATANDEFATVNITDPVDITSGDVADRTAYVDVMAEDQVTSKSFEIVYTFGSVEDVRFNILQEEFSETGTYEVEAYPGYTSGAMFDGDEHKFDDEGSTNYPVASGGAAIKFGDWSGVKYTEMVMKAQIEGYTNLRVGFAITHESNGWGDNGCGLTNNFVLVEYTLDSVEWDTLNMDSLALGSGDWPCGGQPFGFVEMGEHLPVDDMGYITLRFSHSSPSEHPFYMDDIVISGSPISTDASLNNMSLDEGTLSPIFDPYTYEYTAELPIGTTTTPTITAEATDENALVTIDDAVDVTSSDQADRTSTVTVTAQDGVTTKDYTIVFNVKKNNDATLSDLSVANATLDPEFSVLTFDYTVELPANTTETPSVTANTTDPNAMVNETPATDVTSDNVAERTTEILVTAEDGETTLTYTIEFNVLTSINSNLVDHVYVYPNPFGEKLYIDNTDHITRIEICTINGQVITAKKAEFGSVIDLDMSNYNKGIYLIKLYNEDGLTSINKLIKQ